MIYTISGMLCDANYLEHHGVKGMKWGIRRYQNPDGSLTAAGKARYLVGGKDSNAAEPESAEKNPYDHSTKKKSKLDEDILLTVFVPHILPITLTKLTVDAIQSHGANKLKNATEERIKNQPIDKETGLHLKGDVQFTEDEDIKAVNPGFKNFDDDTKNNCLLCSLTYEMRQRGYDCTANGASYGYDTNDMKHWFKGIESKRAESSNKLFVKASESQPRRTLDMMKQEPNTRGLLNVIWKTGLTGHSMYYKVNGNGDVSIIDTQTGTKYTNPNKIYSLLSTCLEAQYARIDNLAFDKQTIKEVCH